MGNLVSHTNPNGKSYSSQENRCRANLHKLEKLLERGYEIAGIKKEQTKEPEFKIVMAFGKPMKLTIEEYNTHWNFRIDK